MNARIYSALIALYPAGLRHDFGEEMTQVFLEDLADSRRLYGFRGAVRVWWRSLKELCRIVVPAEVSKREIAVPLIMFVIQELYLGFIMLMVSKDPHAVMPKSLGDMVATAMVAGLVPAFIGSVALRIGNRSVPVPLNLSSK